MCIRDSLQLDYLYLDASRRESSLILKYLDQISERKKGGEAGYDLEIVGLLNLLWRNVFSLSEKGQPETEDTKASDIRLQKDMISYIHQHFSEKITLDDIAASVGVCRSKCCRIFKKYLNKTPIDFLNAYRLEVSMRLLTDTAMSITEIALSLSLIHI